MGPKTIHDQHTMDAAKAAMEHPGHYAFKMALRDAVLEAMDETAKRHGMTQPKDRDLPELFKCVDAMAATLWVRHYA